MPTKNPFSREPVTFSLRLPADLARDLDEMAARQGRSRSNVIRYLLTKALEGK
jgi:metal-responsive CopG/Arc/MetJ family transcriptional regulator